MVRKDFYWLNTIEPHAERRKKILKEHPDIKKLMRHEPLTKYIALTLMTIQFVMAYHLRDSFGHDLWFWLYAYFIGGSSHQVILLCCHEAAHNLLFKSFFLNKCFGIFMNLPMLVPHFTLFKYYHMEHHKQQGKDGTDADLPTRFEARMLSSTVGKVFFLFFHMWFYALRPVFIKSAPITKWVVVNYLTQALFTFVLVSTLGWGPIFYLLASDHFAGSIHPLAFHFIGEHYVFAEPEETYSYYGILNKFTLNVGYHNEHHDFPSVPWTKLPDLYKIAKPSYSKLPYHNSYSAMIWKFITSNDYSLYSRVKRE